MSLSHPGGQANGVYASLLTPRRPGLAEPDTATLLDYVDRMERAGVDGLVLFGSAGELIHFDLASRTQALKMAVRRSRVPVIANASHSTLDGATALAQEAVEWGAAAILLSPPYFYSYRDEDIEEFYVRFCRDVTPDVPIYLFNVPYFGGRISEPLVRRLLETEQFAGIVEAAGDWKSFESLARVLPKAKVVTGSDRLFRKARACCATAGVSDAAAAIPELLVAIEHAVRTGAEAHADRLDACLQEFLDRVDVFPGALGLQTAAAARGWKVNEPAVPAGAKTRREQEEFRTWLKEWLPNVLKECARRDP